MAKQYTPTNGSHAKIFKNPPETYPFIDLTIETKGKQYDGATKLANFVLRQAIDSDPDVARRFANRDVSLVGRFLAGGKDLGLADLQVRAHHTSLRIVNPRTMLDLLMGWGRSGDVHHFKGLRLGLGYEREDFPHKQFPADEATVSILPSRALERGLGNDVLRSPAVASSIVFGDLESDLTKAAQNSSFKHTLRLDR